MKFLLGYNSLMTTTVRVLNDILLHMHLKKCPCVELNAVMVPLI